MQTNTFFNFSVTHPEKTNPFFALVAALYERVHAKSRPSGNFIYEHQSNVRQ